MVTVFTPAYNRAHTLNRVFESLKSQDYRDFEWIIVDDGSSDDTEGVIQKFIDSEPGFEIRYIFQNNSGKHIATNRAVNMARGELFITLDSDDGCKGNALSWMVEQWNKIPTEKQLQLKGISVRCCDPKTPDTIMGTPFLVNQEGWLESNDEEIRFKHKIQGEMWGMTRTAVMKEIPYPEAEGLHFFPENVYWGGVGVYYPTRYYNIPLRYYYLDGEDHAVKKINYKENMYIRKYVFGGLIKRGYFRFAPQYFCKQAVGLVRDGLLNQMKICEILRIPETILGKALVLCALPLGCFLANRIR